MIQRMLFRSSGDPAAEGMPDPLEQLLARYSAERLSPSPAASRELRAMIVQAYAEKRATKGQSRGQRSSPPLRWALGASLAALLVFGGSLAAAESGPGDPLYGMRLAIESLTLPAPGSARVNALLDQLEARLAEAREESTRRSESGVDAAVSAYERTLSTFTSELRPGQRNADAAIIEGLQHHAAILRGILGAAPAPAQPGIQRALDETQRAKQAIEQAPAAPPASSPHPGPRAATPGRP